MACPFLALVVRYRMLPMFTYYEMLNVWATVSANVRLPRMFPPTDFHFEKRIGLVSMDLLYIISTHYTEDNQQECLRLSNWFSSWCLGPWMNHLPPVWWSNFSFMFLNESWCVSLAWWRGILYWYLVSIIAFIHCPNVALDIPLIWFHSEIDFSF